MANQETLAAAFGRAAGEELTKALQRIEHCVDQLSDEQVWERPSADMNAIGNLVLHLCGNVRQWIVAGLGGVPDSRNRPAEFAERGPIPRHELLERLRRVVAEAKSVLARQTGEQLLQIRCIQGFEVSGLGAIFDAVPHFRGHTQEIIHMTRALTGTAYRFAWQPKTPAEGA
jgi:hypothetical protein